MLESSRNNFDPEKLSVRGTAKTTAIQLSCLLCRLVLVDPVENLV
jgi:hypothetical protein